jgi:ABC-type sulfate/molybdate transport systems ATPase subunit
VDQGHQSAPVQETQRLRQPAAHAGTLSLCKDKGATAQLTISGKSVLLRHIIGLEEPDAGEILIEGESVRDPKYRGQ